MPIRLDFPRSIRAGAGAVEHLGDVLVELGLRRPVLVTDAFLVGTGAAHHVMAVLAAAGLDARLFAETVPDPTTASLNAGHDAVRQHRADCIVGLGGGSPMDTAKALAVLAAQGGHMRDYKAPRDNPGPALPVVAVPTTAGSGSEATRFAVISDSETDEKMLCPGLAFLPVAAVVDVELSMSMPPRLTADTGIDALTHAIEAYVSRRSNLVSDALALAAVRTVAGNLERAYRDGGDTVAREGMMLASTQAGMAFSNASVALVHGMSRPIGAHFHVAHGLSNAMLLPTVMQFSLDGSTHRYADCARAYGAANATDNDAVAAGKLLDAVRDLCRDLAVPTPQSYGIDLDDWRRLVPTMARQAIDSGSPANNPVIADAGQIEDMYLALYSR